MNVITVDPGFLADNYFAAIEPMAHFGIMALPLGEGLNAPPSNEDIARVIVGALVDPARHIGKSYRPTGPRLMSPEEIATTIGKALGRRVRYQDAPMSPQEGRLLIFQGVRNREVSPEASVDGLTAFQKANAASPLSCQFIIVS